MNLSRIAVASLTAAALSVGALAAPAYAETPTPAPSASATELPDPEGYLAWPVTGKATITHPTWGKVSVRSALDTATRRAAFVVHRGGTVLFAQEFTDLTAFTLASPAQDATGNVFINYNPGRYNGIIVLRPNTSNFTVLAHSLDRLAEGLKFYEGALVGPGKDGRYMVETSVNDCTPHCATGTITKTLWAWNGKTYVAQPKAKPTAAPKPKATAKPKATTKPKATAQPTATAKPTATANRGVPAKTGGEQDFPILPLAAGSLLAVGSAGWLVGRHRRP